MSQATADMIGTTDAIFTFTLDAGEIDKAYMDDHPDDPLTVDATGREVTIPKLAASDSLVVLVLIWGPDEPDATIDVGTVTSGTATAANPKHTIDSGNNPGYVKLFGK